jgi:aspartate/methionine/tyrosine aminotransferase
MSKPMRDFALEVHFSKWEFVAKFNLTGSDAENLTLGELLAFAGPETRAAFDSVSLAYTETWGAPALREEIARTYDHIETRDVLCFAGAEEGIYAAMKVLLSPGDHVIVLTPNYQAAETLPLSVCEVTGIALDARNNWALDVDRLRDAIRPNTKMVSINFPNNPTGRIIDRAQFDAIVELCRRNGIWLFSDEVYRLIERDPRMRLPQAVDAYERGISLNVMSKAYGLPGLRIGWLACRDRELLGRFERYKHYLSICNSAPSEFLAIIALQARERILARNRAIIDSNLILLGAFFQEYSNLFDWRVPDGGCVGFVRYKGAQGVQAFTDRLVNETGVLLLPASVYRSELNDVPTNYFRIGYGHSYLPTALAVFREWLRSAGRYSQPAL